VHLWESVFRSNFFDFVRKRGCRKNRNENSKLRERVQNGVRKSLSDRLRAFKASERTEKRDRSVETRNMWTKHVAEKRSRRRKYKGVNPTGKNGLYSILYVKIRKEEK